MYCNNVLKKRKKKNCSINQCYCIIRNHIKQHNNLEILIIYCKFCVLSCVSKPNKFSEQHLKKVLVSELRLSDVQNSILR
jgi:hypothetical protein